MIHDIIVIIGLIVLLLFNMRVLDNILRTHGIEPEPLTWDSYFKDDEGMFIRGIFLPIMTPVVLFAYGYRWVKKHIWVN